MIHHHPKMYQWLSAVILCAANVANAVEIRFADRVSLHPSQPTEVVLTGDKLRGEDGAVAQLWTSFPATVDLVDGDSKDRNVVRYRITPSRPIGGIVAIRAYDNQSISQAMLFSVESLPSQGLPAPADLPIKLPAVFDCSSEGLGDRSIAFECAKGQQFIAEIVGARIGSEVDGLLILRDHNQKELAYVDDHAVTGSDPILKWTAQYQGIHHLVVRDVEYRGGLRMQVRITEQATAATCFPNAVRLGESRSVEQSTVADSDADPKRAVATGVASSGLTSLRIPSVIASLAQTDLPIYVERTAAKNESPVPSVFCGRLEEATEFDSVFISVCKEDWVVIDFLQQDTPFVGVVQLLKEGREIAKHHFGSDPNGRLRYQVVEDGEYEIQVRDALGRCGPGYEYAMSVQNKWMPAILRVSRARKNTKHRNDILHRQIWHAPETLPIFVHCDRRGYQGPCGISAFLDGQACQVEGTITEQQNENEIEIHLPESFKSTSEPTVAHLQLFGKATVDGAVMNIPLNLRDHVKRDFAKMTVSPSIVSSQIAVLIKPEIKPIESQAKEEKK